MRLFPVYVQNILKSLGCLEGLKCLKGFECFKGLKGLECLKGLKSLYCLTCLTAFLILLKSADGLRVCSCFLVILFQIPFLCEAYFSMRRQFRDYFCEVAMSRIQKDLPRGPAVALSYKKPQGFFVWIFGIPYPPVQGLEALGFGYLAQYSEGLQEFGGFEGMGIAPSPRHPYPI